MIDYKKEKILKRSFFERDTVLVAEELLGKVLVHKYNNILVSGRIVETEAYCGSDDLASHAAHKKSKRNSVMFGPVGHAYIYLIYGLHTCINVVARAPEAAAGAVLIRALEPLEAIEFIEKQRNVRQSYNLTNGPGKIGQAFGISLNDTGVDMTNKEGHLYILDAPALSQNNYTCSKRIGITKNPDVLWRFFILNNPWVSRY